MGVVAELLRNEADGSVSFGNYELDKKAKVEDFPHAGDLLKVKTFAEITKLEKNGMFVYESVPGTAVSHFTETSDGVSFVVSGKEDAQITLGLEENALYEIFVGDECTGAVQTGVSGKLSINVEIAGVDELTVKVCKA